MRLSSDPDHGVIMLTAVKLVDQWAALERRLPIDWETISLRLSTEQPDEVGEAARVLGPMNVGRVGDQLAVTVRRAGGASGPEAARRLFGRLDQARIWCLLEQDEIGVREPDDRDVGGGHGRRRRSPRRGTRLSPSSPRAGATCSAASSSHPATCCRGPRCSALPSTRRATAMPWRSRSAARAATVYGVSPAMARRCFERLDAEGIEGEVSVLRVVSDTDNVATQGPVWYVGGKVL